MEKKDKWAGIVIRRAGRAPESLDERHEIVVQDGKHMLRHPWGQLIPAHNSEIYFWQLVQDMQTLMGDEMISEWSRAQNLDSEKEAIVRRFVEHIGSTSAEAARLRREKRISEIREVREECGLDPETGEYKKVT